MKKIELLAPAGSIESLHAAVNCGADAVYLGGSKFSARAYASNFDEEGMTKAVDYCHLYNVKIYVTLNTLIKEEEMEEAIEYVKFLYTIGVDALIIQDTGLAYLIRKNFPDFELHGSTQMTVHNGEGALFLKDLGFKRIVLSRELSLREVEHISKDFDVETEIFVHGALCICYSGQCLMSSMIGGRSGNRGRCAQPCRLPYTLINKSSGEEKSAYILSPKDICTIENINEIIESGTSSLKIEGRMKKPEYVAGVVESYRKAIDSYYGQNSFDVKKEHKKLLKLFNREGFSKAYMFGNAGRDMMSYSFPKNTGIYLGKALKDSTVVLEDDLALKDGIRFNEDGFVLSKIIKDGKEVSEAFKGERVKLIPTTYKSNDMLYKTSDTKLIGELANSYKDAFLRKMALNLKVKFKVDSSFTLSTIYDGKEFAFPGNKVETAVKKPLDKEKIIENLRKTGDTAFYIDKIEFDDFEEGFLPVSSINGVRRDLTQGIERYLINKYKRNFNNNLIYMNDKNTGALKINPKNLVMVNHLEQLRAVEDLEIEDIAVNIFMRYNSINVNDIKNRKVYLKVPNIIKEEFTIICKTIEELLPYIKGVVTSNLGIINRFKGRTNIIGDYKLNIFNSYSLDLYKEVLAGATLSLELNKKELSKLLVNSKSIPCGVKVYGKTELMVSEYCPVGSVMGGKDQCSSCKGNCSEGNFTLKDRKGEEFSLDFDKFCRSYIYNTVPINLIPNLDELKKLKVDFYRLDFVDENYEKTLEILKAFKEGKWEGDFSNYTRGHYKRGVE